MSTKPISRRAVTNSRGEPVSKRLRWAVAIVTMALFVSAMTVAGGVLMFWSKGQ